jgi:hypothetical protein
VIDERLVKSTVKQELATRSCAMMVRKKRVGLTRSSRFPSHNISVVTCIGAVDLERYNAVFREHLSGLVLEAKNRLSFR